jgi:hypothetical protein
MGACETTPTTTHDRGDHPATPTPLDPQEALPRSRSSAAAWRHQARSSSPAPAGAALRALQLDPARRDGTNRRRRGKATTTVPTPNTAAATKVTGSIQHALLTDGAPMGAETTTAVSRDRAAGRAGPRQPQHDASSSGSTVTASRCCPPVPAPQPQPGKPAPMTLAAELNPHKTELNPQKAVETASRAGTNQTGLPSSARARRHGSWQELSRRPRSAVPVTLRCRHGPRLRTRSRRSGAVPVGRRDGPCRARMAVLRAHRRTMAPGESGRWLTGACRVLGMAVPGAWLPAAG